MSYEITLEVLIIRCPGTHLWLLLAPSSVAIVTQPTDQILHFFITYSFQLEDNAKIYIKKSVMIAIYIKLTENCCK